MPTTFDTTSRPGYMFNQLEQKWYPISGLVATDYNYTWLGTNSYSNTVNFLDNVIAKSKFNCFLNPAARTSAIPSPQVGLITFIQQNDVGATLNLFQYWNGSAWTNISDPDNVTLTATQTLTNKTLTSPTINTPIINGGYSVSSTNAQSGTTYSFVLADLDKIVEGSNAGATTFTIPKNATTAFPIGGTINILQTGLGQITLTGETLTTATYASGGAPSATTFVISASNPAIAIGQSVTGTGFAANTLVTNVSSTTITVSPAISTQVSGTISFKVALVATPGLKIRTQWSSASILKRGTDSWVALGDLTS